MRITGGALKGRSFHDVKLNLRPTTNRAKQGLLNILNNRLDWGNSKALDLFAGTGSITYELASRGCSAITTVDISGKNCKIIRENLKVLGLKNVKIIRADTLSFLLGASEEWSLIIADPPYDYSRYEVLVRLVFEKNLLAAGGLLIVEHSRRTSLATLPFFIEQRKYGEVNFSFFGE